jgi:hypothetical protein
VLAMYAMLAEHSADQIDPAWPALIEAPVPVDKTILEPLDADDEYIYYPN